MEEEHILPVVANHVTTAEWDQMGRAAGAQVNPGTLRQDPAVGYGGTPFVNAGTGPVTSPGPHDEPNGIISRVRRGSCRRR